MTDDDNDGGVIWNAWNRFTGVPEYNILLLGETGAGKSTTINAYANYLKYATFDEAKSSEFEQIIPSQFTLPDPESGEPIVIQSGDENDVNERPGSGASSTQAPSTYVFKFKDRLLRIIDTPGMGDTSGVRVDRENFDKILAHLHNFKQLHGILILMKANETRRTAFFRYCITELLAHLHKSACLNLVFCFTFSRNSHYGPGEGFSTVKSFLKNELKDVQFELEPGKNCFFIDNEAYRFLVAKKSGYPFPTSQEASYKDSWVKSVEQTNAMWEHITKSKPHNLANTISLNNARKFILEMAQPMVLLQSQIESNILHIQKKEDLLRNFSGNKEELAKHLTLEVDDLEMRELPYPRTTCTAAKCTELIKYQGQDKVHYKNQCHPHCYLTDVAVNTVGHESLKHCDAMSGRPNCTECGCPWQKHMHIRVEYITVKRTVIDGNKEIEVNSAENQVETIERTIQNMKNLVREYQEEYQVILDVCCKFAYVLIENSNTPYNRFIEPYLDLLIAEEQKKLDAIPRYPRDKYESLQRMKTAHRESIKILQEAIRNKKQSNISLKDIYTFKDRLVSLRQTGQQFKQMMDMACVTKQKDADNMPVKTLDFTTMVPNVSNANQNKKSFWQQFFWWWW